MLKTKKPKRILSLLLTAVMVLSLMPTMMMPVWAAVNQRTDALVIAYNTPTNTTHYGDEGWAWYLTAEGEYTDKTLVLNGVDIVTDSQYALDVPSGTTIVLMAGSTNMVKSTYNGDLATAGVHGSMTGSLTITGSGTLNAEGGSTSGNYQYSTGIYMGPDGSSIIGGTINATGGTVTEGGTSSSGISAASLTISSGTVTATGAALSADATQYAKASRGIYVSGALTLSNNAIVNANGGASSGSSYGTEVSGSLTLSDSAKLTAMTGGSSSYNHGVYTQTLEISNNAELAATSGTSASSLSCGVRATSTITLSDDAKVTGTAGNISSSFSRGVMSGSTITMNGGTLSGTGGDSTSGTSAGVYATTVSMTAGTITAQSGNTTGTSSALWLTSLALTGADVKDNAGNKLSFDNTNKGYYEYNSSDTLTKYATATAVGSTDSTLKQDIDVWLASEGITGITVTDTDATTITVEGTASKTAASTLDLTIPAGVTVDWQATLAGSANPVINIKNDSGANAAFHMTAGELASTVSAGTNYVIQNWSPNTSIELSGGTITGGGGNKSNGIHNNSTGSITVSGGTVNGGTGVSSYGIYNNSTGNVTVSGGTVYGGSGIGTNQGIHNQAASITTISGGEVRVSDGNTSTSGSSCIYENEAGGTISISGGKLINSKSYAISAKADTNLTVGGNAFIFGKKASVIYGPTATPCDTAIIIAWSGVGTSYSKDSTDDLTVTPSDATANWDVVDGKSGITYTNDNNTGFIEVPGVTVNDIDITLAGSGTSTDPYLIKNTADLSILLLYIWLRTWSPAMSLSILLPKLLE